MKSVSIVAAALAISAIAGPAHAADIDIPSYKRYLNPSLSTHPVIAAHGHATAAPVVIQLNEDGTVGGFAGCNYFRGTYSWNSEYRLSFKDIAATRKDCDERAMAVEDAFLGALGEWTVIAHRDSNLVINPYTASEIVLSANKPTR